MLSVNPFYRLWRFMILYIFFVVSAWFAMGFLMFVGYSIFQAASIYTGMQLVALSIVCFIEVFMDIEYIHREDDDNG